MFFNSPAPKLILMSALVLPVCVGFAQGTKTQIGNAQQDMGR